MIVSSQLQWTDEEMWGIVRSRTDHIVEVTGEEALRRAVAERDMPGVETWLQIVIGRSVCGEYGEDRISHSCYSVLSDVYVLQMRAVQRGAKSGWEKDAYQPVPSRDNEEVA